MSLTKHLYRLDEVRAAFLWALHRGVAEESLFWLEELEESCYGGEARRLLFISWLMHIGLKRIGWLEGWAAVGGRQEDRRLLCWQLATCKDRDSSLWWLLWAEALEFGGETIDAAPTAVEPRIQAILESLQKDMRAYNDLASNARAAINRISAEKKIHADSWKPFANTIPPVIVQTMDSWSELALKDRRVFAIPYECLYGMTWRGIGADTTSELSDLKIEHLLASPYWRSQLGPFVDGGLWRSADALEEFYDTHFDAIDTDIPDEWSAAERQKSHGRGATGGPDAPLGRWWRNWVYEDHIFISGAVAERVQRWVAGQKIGNYASILDRLIGIYKARDA